MRSGCALPLVLTLVTACTLTSNLDDLKGAPADASAGTGGVPSDAGPDAGERAPVPPIADLCAGGQHACIIDSTSAVFCWGANSKGELGGGTTGGKSGYFVEAKIPETATSLACGAFHTCATGTSGSLYCWGAGAAGQLGIGQADRHTPTQVPLDNVSRVVAGANHTCAIAGGKLSCWGSNGAGQVGASGTGAVTAPTAVTLPGQVSAAAAGSQHSCAVVGQDLYCWGSNDFGQLGSTAAGGPTPTLAPLNGVTPQLVVGGGTHTCAVTASSQVYCWGGNLKGQLGIGKNTSSEPPSAIPGLSVSMVALGEQHSCSTGGGQAACWGADDQGQLGNGNDGSASSPAQLSLSQVILVATGTAFSCAVAANGGTLWCWGDNAAQQLGERISTTEPAPVLLPLTH